MNAFIKGTSFIFVRAHHLCLRFRLPEAQGLFHQVVISFQNDTYGILQSAEKRYKGYTHPISIFNQIRFLWSTVRLYRQCKGGGG